MCLLSTLQFFFTFLHRPYPPWWLSFQLILQWVNEIYHLLAYMLDCDWFINKHRQMMHRSMMRRWFEYFFAMVLVLRCITFVFYSKFYMWQDWSFPFTTYKHTEIEFALVWGNILVWSMYLHDLMENILEQNLHEGQPYPSILCIYTDPRCHSGPCHMHVCTCMNKDNKWPWFHYSQDCCYSCVGHQAILTRHKAIHWYWWGWLL